MNYDCMLLYKKETGVMPVDEIELEFTIWRSKGATS